MALDWRLLGSAMGTITPACRHLYRRLRPYPVTVVIENDERFRRTRHEWIKSAQITVFRQRIGLVNTRLKPLRVTVIVERVSEQVVEKPLQVSDTVDGTTVINVPPRNETPVFVDLVDHVEHNGFAFMCYAQSSHEDMMPRHAQIDLRIQGDEGVEGRARISARTHLIGGIPSVIQCDLLPL